MYRFKVSKYKNAAPRVPKKEVREQICGFIIVLAALLSYNDLFFKSFQAKTD